MKNVYLYQTNRAEVTGKLFFIGIKWHSGNKDSVGFWWSAKSSSWAAIRSTLKN